MESSPAFGAEGYDSFRSSQRTECVEFFATEQRSGQRGGPISGQCYPKTLAGPPDQQGRGKTIRGSCGRDGRWDGGPDRRCVGGGPQRAGPRGEIRATSL